MQAKDMCDNEIVVFVMVSVVLLAPIICQSTAVSKDKWMEYTSCNNQTNDTCVLGLKDISHGIYAFELSIAIVGGILCGSAVIATLAYIETAEKWLNYCLIPITDICMLVGCGILYFEHRDTLKPAESFWWSFVGGLSSLAFSVLRIISLCVSSCSCENDDRTKREKGERHTQEEVDSSDNYI